MTLKRIEVKKFREKSHELNRNKLSTTISLVVASIESDVQTNVKRFGYRPAIFAVYNSTKFTLANEGNIFSKRIRNVYVF